MDNEESFQLWPPIAVASEIWLHIFSYLPIEDKYSVFCSTREWQDLFQNHNQLWNDVSFIIEESSPSNEDLNEKITQFICDHAKNVSRLSLAFSQLHEPSSEKAIKILSNISSSVSRRLRALKVGFTAPTNPLFYSGSKIIKAVNDLLSCPEKESCTQHEHLREVDFSKLQVCFNDNIVNNLIHHHGSYLNLINLQNQSLVCNISKDCMHNLTLKCPNLQTLAVHMSTFDAESLNNLGKSCEKKFKLLQLFCQREDKYSVVIESKDWNSFCKKFPDFRVNFYFDHTCPLYRILGEILQPVIPVSVLKLRVLATVTELVYFIADSYSKTLEVFDVTTTSSVELDNAILYLARKCQKLKEINVWCRLSKHAVTTIVAECTQLKKYKLAYNTACEK
eukprot:gene9547-10534_t